MSLEVWYWIALGIGVGFLVLSLVFGDVFDFLDFLDLDIGEGVAITPVLFTAIAAFGAGGLLGLSAFDVSAGISALVGLAASVVFGGLAAVFFSALRRQEAPQTFDTQDLVDARGRCDLAIVPGKSGRVSIRYEGMTRSYTATSKEEIRVGEDVVVVEAVGNSLEVKRASAQ